MMKTLFLIFVVCFLLFGCMPSKPLINCGTVQEKVVNRSCTVIYSDYTQSEIEDTVKKATDTFFKRSNIKVTVDQWYKTTWPKKDVKPMCKHTTYVIKTNKGHWTDWYIMVYKRNPLEWFMTIMTGFPPLGMSQVNGNMILVTVLWPRVLEHEMWHKAWSIE